MFNEFFSGIFYKHVKNIANFLRKEKNTQPCPFRIVCVVLFTIQITNKTNCCTLFSFLSHTYVIYISNSIPPTVIITLKPTLRLVIIIFCKRFVYNVIFDSNLFVGKVKIREKEIQLNCKNVNSEIKKYMVS